MYLFFIFPFFLLSSLSLSSSLFPVASLWVWWVSMTASGSGSDGGWRSGLRWGSGLLGWRVLWWVFAAVGLCRGFFFWWLWVEVVVGGLMGGGFVIWFWMGMVCGGPVVVGLLVAAMVEVFFSFFLAVVGGGEWMWWLWVDVDVEVSVFLLWFFFSFFVSGGCGMGGGFLVGGWYCGAGGGMRKRETEEREENKKLLKINKETFFKWNGKKYRSFDIGCIVKWCVICYKNRFWKGKC